MHKMYNYNAEKAKRGMMPAFPELDGKFGDGSGGGDDMLQRIKDLEVKVATLVTDVAIIKDKLATKEDIQAVKTELHKELNAQTWKIITALVITVLIAVFSRYFIK